VLFQLAYGHCGAEGESEPGPVVVLVVNYRPARLAPERWLNELIA
jgi:hypothetical protein